MKYNSRYQKDALHFDRKGNVRRGISSNSINHKYETENPAEEDRKNRKNVVDEIEDLVKSGISVDDACSKMVEKHKDKFTYFPEESLPKIFSGWYNGRTRKRRPIEERGKD